MKKEWLVVVCLLLYFLWVKEPEVIYEPCIVDQTFYVELKGEVVHPGVYEINSRMRLFEVIEMAGGITEEANIENIKMSESLSDEETIRIPSIYENRDSLLININTATIEQLLSIPGLGQTKSEAILRYREVVGEFASLEELRNINGIGESTFASISPFLSCE